MARASQVGVIICSFQEHQGQLIQGSYRSSKGVRKERRKGGKTTRVRKHCTWATQGTDRKASLVPGRPWGACA